MSSLPTAAELAVLNAEIQRKPTDEQLLGDFTSAFPRIPDMDRQIHTQWGPLSAREAVEREKREFLARRRRAIAEAKQRREEAVKAAAEREREQKKFEQCAARGEYRSALRRALVSYEEGLSAAREKQQGRAIVSKPNRSVLVIDRSESTSSRPARFLPAIFRVGCFCALL